MKSKQQILVLKKIFCCDKRENGWHITAYSETVQYFDLDTMKEGFFKMSIQRPTKGNKQKTTNKSRKTKTCNKSNYSKIKIYSKKSLRNLYEKEN